MKITDNEKTLDEKYTEKWFNYNGFKAKLEKRDRRNSIFSYEKDGISGVLEVPFCVTDLSSYLSKSFMNGFKLKKKLHDIEEKLSKEGKEL